jgi:WD40 repeat protein
MASGDAGSNVLLWDRSVEDGAATLVGKHDGWVNAVAFSPDSRHLATGGDDTTVRLWDITAEAAVGRVLDGQGATINAVSFTPDGEQLVSGGEGGLVRYRDLSAERPFAEPIAVHRGPVWDVAFGPDGSRLVIAMENRTEKLGEVWLWDSDAERFPDEPLGRHEYSARAVALCSRSAQVASAGGDERIRLWDIPSGEPLGEPLPISGIVSDLAFSEDCRWLAAAGQDEAVWLWGMDLRTRACRIADRNLTRDEWRRYLGEEEPYRRTCE